MCPTLATRPDEVIEVPFGSIVDDIQVKGGTSMEELRVRGGTSMDESEPEFGDASRSIDWPCCLSVRGIRCRAPQDIVAHH
ncbi:hypothetical protein U1Q18_052207 [Sarracenia purpurea var. burkii]